MQLLLALFTLALSLLLVAVDAFRSQASATARRLGTRDVSVRASTYSCYYEELSIPTKKGIYLSDLTPLLRSALEKSQITEGTVTVLSRHTTTAITINEMEGRLVDDIRQYLLKLAPPDYPYLHNDLHPRNGPPGWPGGDEAWRAQEPVNAHSHLLTMILGSSESIPVSEGKLKMGTWQSCILAEMDGPRVRTVAVQISGLKPSS